MLSSFPLHVGMEAGGCHFKEIKSLWRLYKFCAYSTLCTYYLAILFCLSLSFYTFVSYPGNPRVCAFVCMSSFTDLSSTGLPVRYAGYPKKEISLDQQEREGPFPALEG